MVAHVKCSCRVVDCAVPPSPEGPGEWPTPAAALQCLDPPPGPSAAPPQKHWASLCMGCWYGNSNPVPSETLVSRFVAKQVRSKDKYLQTLCIFQTVIIKVPLLFRLQTVFMM